MAFLIDDRRGMKAEDCSWRNANAAARDSAQNQRASRQAGSVDDNTLARASHAREELEIVADDAARARNDTDIGESGRHGERNQEEDK
jgi:hypothetical protein